MKHPYIFILIVLVLCFSKTLYTHALSVEVKNVSGLLGENGTEIECSYSKENVLKIDVVYIVVFNRSSLQFQSIAEYFPNLNPTLTPPGQYLRGRVTLMGIAQSSMKVVLIFNKLMCIDETFYRCVVRFTDASLNRKEKTSSNMRISVQVSPFMPRSINLLKQQTGIKRTSTPAITDGDDVTFVCSGNVGKPPANFQFQMIRSDTLYMNYTDTNAIIKELLVSDDCSYIRTSYITFNVTAEDNQSVMRCTAVSTLSEGYMYVESEPLDVNYAVKMPTIVKHPNKGDYLEGLDTSITLNCITDGNPKPSYTWYKDNEIEAISTSHILTITNLSTSNSGLYTCFVSNTINDIKHTERVQMRVSILKGAYEENETSSATFRTSRSTTFRTSPSTTFRTSPSTIFRTSPSSTFRTSVCNKTPLLIQSSIDNTAVIVLGAVCGSMLLVFCVILFGVIRNKNKCLLMRSSNDRTVDYVNTTQQQNSPLNEVADSALDVHNYEQLSRRECVYENTNF